MDVFEDEREVTIVALPGPPRARSATTRGLLVRAERRIPFDDGLRNPATEISYGWFERRIPLPPRRWNRLRGRRTAVSS